MLKDEKVAGIERRQRGDVESETLRRVFARKSCSTQKKYVLHKVAGDTGKNWIPIKDGRSI